MSFSILKIALDAPLDQCFDYRWPNPGSAGNVDDAGDTGDTPQPQIGQLVRVPFGRREVTGLIVALPPASELAPEKIKPVIAVLHQLPPLSAQWLALCQFAAGYYHRPLGEVALPGLPKNLRSESMVALNRALKKLAQTNPARPTAAGASSTADASAGPEARPVPELNAEQQAAVDAIGQQTGFAVHLLFGVTGSGKTEVYLHASAQILARQSEAQILILVPEINLTPQLENNIRARFPDLPLATLHSSLSEGERTRHWLAAHLGQARIILGTRLAILASLPHLQLIIVDEEHDPSYKQQEGLRYSARDLAVWRARQLGIGVVLGSATPSLESWQHAQVARYKTLALSERAVRAARLPRMSLVDLGHDKPVDGLSLRLINAVRQRLEQGQQSLLFLNRRGYAPVLCCEACGWISDCSRCTAHMVLHKPQRRLRCHHCSLELYIPKHCPSCGNVDLAALGRGTQRVEEGLQALFPKARLLRIDADSTKHKGSAQAAFEQVHAGDVDILIGTQMVAKGHDFKRLNLVGILNPDSALFSHDYRASERLFAQLLQVAGRAGRAAQEADDGPEAEVLIQTRYPDHPLYASLLKHDYPHFASHLLSERQQAQLPPFMYQALLRAEARELAGAIEFLQFAKNCCEHDGVVLHDPIPLAITKVANVERAQLLVEAGSRPVLQAFLTRWVAALRASKWRGQWGLEVDPVDI